MIIRKKIFLLLSWLFVSLFPVFSLADGDCRAVFISVKDEIYHKVLNDKPLFIKSYKGQEGYLRFIEELSETSSMLYVFVSVHKLLNEKEKKELGWQAYRGRVSEYKELRFKILDEGGQVRQEYIGMEGYALFAEREFSGDMQKTYINVSSVLGKKEMNELGWQSYQGRVSEYKELRFKILDEGGQVRQEYIGMEGYALFAEREFFGDMKKTYENVSSVLGKKEMNELGWQKYQGRVSEYKELRFKILDEGGQVRQEYIGMEGYALFAEREFFGDMQKTYKNVSSVLGKKEMNELGWQGYQGRVSEYKELRFKILDEGGQVRQEYIGMEGYALFAEREFFGDMQKTYENVSSVLGKKEMNELGWQKYQGRVSEYKELRFKILDEGGQVRQEYIGMEGYALFAEREFFGNMQKTYINVSSVLGGVKKTRELGLGWKVLQGKVEQFYALRELFDKHSIEELKGWKGQELVAEEIFSGDKRRAYQNVSVLRKELLGSQKAFSELNWLKAGW